MSEPGKSGRPFFTLPRTFALAGLVLLVSAGLCGIQFRFQPEQYVTVEGLIGAAGLLLGCGLLLGGTARAIFALVSRMMKTRKNKS